MAWPTFGCSKWGRGEGEGSAVPGFAKVALTGALAAGPRLRGGPDPRVPSKGVAKSQIVSELERYLDGHDRTMGGVVES